MMISSSFKDEFSAVLARTYMAGWTCVSEQDIADHVSGRYEMFAQNVIPWIERHTTLFGQTWIEVGSGTGSSTLALAEAGATVVTYEISQPSMEAAKERLCLLGFGDRAIHAGELFGFSCRLVREESKVDGVLLAATLEHMTFAECQEVIRASWYSLRSGGLLAVIDTPNRLCTYDYHTAQLPFFSMLPSDVRLAYAGRSPRGGFVRDFSSLNSESQEMLTRWGCGISYHEFELAIGNDVHSHVVANGYEAEIVRRWSIIWEDDHLRRIFDHYQLRQNIGFTRHNLFLIFRKP